MDHFGSYACRNINRGQSASQGTTEGSMAGGTRSQHATANALDISAFTLANGRRIALTQWRDAPDPRGEAGWLRGVQAGACRFFDGVLGPDYNAAHSDHFHLETGGYGMCR